jgi:two-component system chemotaxis response regulator CheB
VTPPRQKLRVLVVDDSTVFRRSLVDALSASDEIEVVGTAANGEEALQSALSLKPHVITLDLEMPRMDGFTFLRILVARQPTAVVVVSSHASRENVFKALELGAVEFVVKPSAHRPVESSIRDEVVQKVLLTRHIRPVGTRMRAPTPSITDAEEIRPRVPLSEPPDPSGARPRVRFVVAIASSTGGPIALLDIASRLPERFPGALCIAQHMPESFTRTFAERLDRKGPIRFNEVDAPEALEERRGYVSPGNQCLVVVPRGGSDLGVALRPAGGERYVPSGDLLLKTAAEAAGPRVIGVVLTGMGDDGLAGARAVREAGGVVVAESEQSAVVYGMPGGVVRAGLANHVLSLGEIASFLAGL